MSSEAFGRSIGHTDAHTDKMTTHSLGSGVCIHRPASNIARTQPATNGGGGGPVWHTPWWAAGGFITSRHVTPTSRRRHRCRSTDRGGPPPTTTTRVAGSTTDHEWIGVPPQAAHTRSRSVSYKDIRAVGHASRHSEPPTPSDSSTSHDNRAKY